jgi:hypothetical protein
VKRAVREFVRNLMWMLAVFGAMGAVLTIGMAAVGMVVGTVADNA